jgi:hypothetical protein
LSGVRPWIRYVAIAGNVLYVLWIVRNGINEGFSGNPVQVASYAGLLLLLALNVALLWRRGD